MKKSLKRILILTLILAVCLCSFTSCMKDADEKQAFIEEFLDCLESEDYERARAYLHPSIDADVESFVKRLESDHGVDISKGIAVVECYGYSYEIYYNLYTGWNEDSSFFCVINVGGKRIDLDILLIKDNNGYGIYLIDATKTTSLW